MRCDRVTGIHPGRPVVSVWDVLIGQEEAVATLRAAAEAGQDIVSGRIASTGALTHAWLFAGPPGSGRSVAARALAAALQCEVPTMDGVDGPGCGVCSGCHTTLAGTHPDVKVVSPEGLSISVEETRDIVASAARRPALNRWQIVIVEDADRMGERAANALLKAIEEPTPRTIFLLCAPSLHPDDVPVTVRSRCRAVTLRTPSAAAIAAVLRADGETDEDAHRFALAAQGHVGRARRLARDGDARTRRAAVLAIPASLDSLSSCFDAADHLLGVAEAETAAFARSRDSAEADALRTALGAGGTGKGAPAAARGAAGAVRELEKRQKSRATRTLRDSLDRALFDLAGFYRDVLLHHVGAQVDPAHPDAADEVAAVAAQVGPVAALQRLDAVLDCREALDLNVKPRIAIEAMTMALRLP